MTAAVVLTATSPALAQRSAAAFDALLDEPALANAWWGVHIVDLTDGEVVYTQNAGKSFIPASNTKLYTTAAALDQLGPDYVYTTRLYHDGTVENGVLKGNLIVRGSGDPTIGFRPDEDDPTALFRAWADVLRRRGITRVEGDLIGDDDLFDDDAIGYEWSQADLLYYYGAEISALSFNDNVVSFAIEARAPGQAGTVSWAPLSTNFVQVQNATVTGPNGSRLDEGYYREPGTNRFVLSSQVPPGRTDEEDLAVHNPTLYFAHVLRETLVDEGISVTGVARDVDALPLKPTYADGRLGLLASHESPPLDSIAAWVNKDSNNLYAELMLRTLGAERPQAVSDAEVGSAEMGLEAAYDTFGVAGVDTSRLHLVDGSGLSRHNLVTPAMTVQLLRYMDAHPQPDVREAFLASLPVGGRDGTLEYRFRGAPAETHVRAKTGTVSHASTLSGYVTGTSGRRYAFSLMCNHYTVPTRVVRAVQDRIVNQLRATY